MQGCFNTTVSYLDRPKEYKFEPPHPVVSGIEEWRTAPPLVFLHAIRQAGHA